MTGDERWTTSAPAKAILFGEHAVNRAQPALVTSIDRRVRCTLAHLDGPGYLLRSGERWCRLERSELAALRRAVDAARADGDTEAIRRRALGDFFAPSAYVLATFLADHPIDGLSIDWQSDVPVGAGLGSGAAVSAALVLALCAAAGVALTARERAHLAWQGDIIAHGGIASGLDSAGTTFGGIVRYTLLEGPEPLAEATRPLPLVIGDTGMQASTAEVNGRVRAWLAAHPEGAAPFPLIGALVDEARAAIEAADLRCLGELLNRNQALLARIGVSSPEIDRLIAAALEAGALGAKLSGSGGGGIIIALCTEERRAAVAEAVVAAGGRAIVTQAGVEGARLEDAPIAPPLRR